METIPYEAESTVEPIIFLSSELRYSEEGVSTFFPIEQATSNFYALAEFTSVITD